MFRRLLYLGTKQDATFILSPNKIQPIKTSMKYPLLIKALTLLSFTFLISIFLLYREGRFNKYLQNEDSPMQTSHNGGTIASAKSDSSKDKKDSMQLVLLSSSKSMILIDKKPLAGGSLKTSKKTNRQLTTSGILSSSKSGVVFTPLSLTKFDSVIFDSLKVKPIKKK